MCSPFSLLYHWRQVGAMADRQVTLSPFYELKVRAVTAFIGLDKRS